MTYDLLKWWPFRRTGAFGYLPPDPEPLDHPEIQKMSARDLADLPYSPFDTLRPTGPKDR